MLIRENKTFPISLMKQQRKMGEAALLTLLQPSSTEPLLEMLDYNSHPSQPPWKHPAEKTGPLGSHPIAPPARPALSVGKEPVPEGEPWQRPAWLLKGIPEPGSLSFAKGHLLFPKASSARNTGRRSALGKALQSSFGSGDFTP